MSRSQARFIDHTTLSALVEGRAAQASLVADDEGGWSILARYGAVQSTLVGQRGKPRQFADPKTAIAYLRGLGITEFVVDATAFEPKAKKSPRVARPDRAVALKQAHEAAAYDRWFREQVKAGIAEADAGKTIPYEPAMKQLRARAKAIAQSRN